MWHFTWVLLTSAFFHRKSVNFAIPRKTFIDFTFRFVHLISNSFNFFWVFKGFFLIMVEILMMSAKLPTVDLLKTKAFWYKGCDLVISVHDACKRLLSRYWNYIVNLVMWPKFGNCSITIREVIITLIL